VHEDNQERKEHQEFQEFPVVLDPWENEVQLDLQDHLDLQELMLWIMVAPDEMENQELLDHLEKLDTQD